jgi:hypothetical protein
MNEEELKNTPFIVIEEIEGKLLGGNHLLINALGAPEGARKQNDGVTFFGNKIFDGEVVINDYAWNVEDQNFTNLRHYFIIYYKKGNLVFN